MKQMTLEQEFSKVMAKHKIVIIRVALDLHGETLYKTTLLEEFKDMYKEMSTHEKSAKVESDLYNEQEQYKTDRYNKVYELCWEIVKNQIPNSRVF